MIVGYFTEEDCKAKRDKVAIAQAQEVSGLTYIRCKVTQRKGVPVLKVWLVTDKEYYNSTEI